MADSSPQIAVADWINREWLPHRMGETFFRAKVRLVSGGEHSFASVNADKTAVGTVCTSGPRNGGKLKVRSDLYFLLMAHKIVRPGGALGLITTNTIMQGDTREVGLEQIVDSGSTIYSAIKSMEWPGEASVHVSIVNIFKGEWKGLRWLS